MKRLHGLLLASALSVGSGSLGAEPVDRVVVRFDSAEPGGAAKPQFIFERELAFEARLEALADSERPERSLPYLDRHLRAAIERHVAEELLAHLAMDPEPSAADMDARLAPAMDASYLGTRPASATLEIPTGVDAALVHQSRQPPKHAEIIFVGQQAGECGNLFG